MAYIEEGLLIKCGLIRRPFDVACFKYIFAIDNINLVELIEINPNSIKLFHIVKELRVNHYYTSYVFTFTPLVKTPSKI